jgi:hypothetical protein
MCFFRHTITQGHTKKRPEQRGTAGTGNNARRIGILFKSNFCRNYIQVYNCFK